MTNYKTKEDAIAASEKAAEMVRTNWSKDGANSWKDPLGSPFTSGQAILRAATDLGWPTWQIAALFGIAMKTEAFEANWESYRESYETTTKEGVLEMLDQSIMMVSATNILADQLREIEENNNRIAAGRF